MAERKGPAPDGSWSRIYAVVRRIPRGTVATYGQVAELAGLPRQARLVGYALRGVGRASTVPWHRVVNAQGRVSARSGDPSGTVEQRLLLEAEGVTFGPGGRLRLERYRWEPRAAATRQAAKSEARSSTRRVTRSAEP
jgi:methylated-DNA-protein-cysteine methyltransferase-like protein